MKKLILAIALSISAAIFAAPAHAQAPQQKTQQVDPAEQANQRLAAWQAEQRTCFARANAVEGKHFRVNPKKKWRFQVRDEVWYEPGNVDLVKLRDCRTEIED